MGCQIRPNAAACYMLDYNVSPKILTQLPCTLMGIPQAVINRLKQDGMITKNRRVYNDYTWRIEWKAGPRLPGMLKWCAEHGHI